MSSTNRSKRRGGELESSSGRCGLERVELLERIADLASTFFDYSRAGFGQRPSSLPYSEEDTEREMHQFLHRLEMLDSR